MEVGTFLKERSGREHARFLTLYLPYLVLACVALLWPADAALMGVDFRNSWWVRSVPSIAGYARKSQFPSATAAYLVLTGVLFLPLFALTLARPEFAFASRARMREAVLKYRRRRPYLMLLAIATGVGTLWISWIQPGYEYAVLPISGQRWALALAGPLFSFFSMSYAALFIAVIGVRFSFFVTVEEV